MAANLLRPCMHMRLARLQGPARSCRQYGAHSRQRRRVVTTYAADEVLRSLSKGNEVAVLVADGTQLVQEACKRHQTAPTAGAAFGRALIGTLLMASFKDADERLQITFKGNGELGSLQVLPFASDETLKQLEANLREMSRCGRGVTDLMHEGLGTREITAKLLEGIGVSDSPPMSIRPRYGPCEKERLRERMKRAVALLGSEEIKKIIQEENKIEVTCEFCCDTYHFEEEEIMANVQASKPAQGMEETGWFRNPYAAGDASEP